VSPATPSAASAARAEAETEPWTEARSETRSETRAETGVASVFAEVFAEFPSGLPPRVVQGTPLGRAEAESEARPAGEWAVGGSEWVGHLSVVLTSVGVTHSLCASEYHDISKTNVMQRDIPVRLDDEVFRRSDLRKT
jgi:hypothetical protein